MSDKIELKLPNKVDYISLVRLTASSVANNMEVNVDEIEDIKVCISEACMNTLNFSDDENIEITFDLKDDGIYIKIKNVVEDIPADKKYSKQGEMGLLIINSLMDKVEFKDGYMTMVKFI